MKKLLFRLFREDFTKFAHDERNKLTHKNLAYWFSDNSGNKYFKFPDHASLPIERLANLKMLYSWLSSGISGEEMQSIIDTMKKALHEGLGHPDATAKIATMINVIEERMKYSFHLELYYNIVATLSVREDESPEAYNNDIQMQKVIAFKELTANGGSYFFFQEKLSQTPINLSVISESEWANLVVESEMWKLQLKQINDWFNSQSKSQMKEQTSTV